MLNKGLLLIRCHHTWAGDDLAVPVRFQCRQLQADEFRRGRIKQSQSYRTRCTSTWISGQIHRVPASQGNYAAGSRSNLGATSADILAIEAESKLGAEVAAKAIIRFDHACFNQDLPRGDIDFLDQIADVLQGGRRIGHEQLIGAWIDHGAAAI